MFTQCELFTHKYTDTRNSSQILVLNTLFFVQKNYIIYVGFLK